MLSERIAGMLNEQIVKEMYSAYLYHDMANYYAHRGLKGFASWFSVQAREELEHAMKINGYLQDRLRIQLLQPAYSRRPAMMMLGSSCMIAGRK